MLRRATIGDMLRRQAARIGNRPAVIILGSDGSRSEVTSAALNRAVNKIANGLAGQGIGRSDVVAMMAPDKDQYAAVYFASLKLGAAFTPINPAYRSSEVTRQLDDAEPAAFFVSRSVADVASSAIAVSCSNPVTISCDGEIDWAVSTWTQLADSSTDDEPESIIDENDLALVMYTSGTESHPKGVAITHRNMLTSTTPAWVMTEYVNQSDVFLLLAPLHTTAGLGTLTTLLSAGATVVLAHTTDPAVVLEIVKSEGITNTSQTPTFYNRLVADPTFAIADLTSLRQCHIYGGKIPKRAVSLISEAAPGVMWATYWGQSELSQLGSIGFFKSIDDVPGGDLRWIGVPVPYLEVRVVDEKGQEAGVGELLCRSPSVMAGYYKNTEASEAAFTDGWLRTGDIVRRDDQGNLFFYDRRKDVIKTGGMNVSSAEVENVLADFPGVADVAVVGIEDPEWSEAIVAWVVPEALQSIEPDDVIEFCKKRIAGYKVPKRVYIVEDLPRDQQGKVRKRSIRSSLRVEKDGFD